MTDTTTGRTIDLDPRGEDLVIRFPYDPAIIPVVRTLPGRRWNAREKIWLVTSTSIRETVRILEPLGFLLTPAARRRLESPDSGAPTFPPLSPRPRLNPTLVAKTGSPKPVDPSEGLRPRGSGEPHRDEASEGVPKDEPEDAALTISQLNERVRITLRRGFPSPLWIRGEILEWNRNAHKNHVYFRIAEKEEGQARPRASVTAVLFQRQRTTVERTLRESGDFELQDGIEVKILGEIDLYPPSGSYQFIVREVDPFFTLGKIAQNREKILRELDRLDLRNRNLSRPWPEIPTRVALITSRGSDAYNDFLDELRRSDFHFEVRTFDAHMQGQKLPSTLMHALELILARPEEFDVIALVRGGGSRSDLAWFDNLELARRIANASVKVVCGIGHHRDVSVLDLITESAKTPTAVAGLLIEKVESSMGSLAELLGRLVDRSLDFLTDRRSRIENTSQGLHRETRRNLATRQALLDEATRRLGRSLPARFRRESSFLNRAAELCHRSTRSRVREARLRIDSLGRHLSLERLSRKTSRETQRLEDRADRALRGIEFRLSGERSKLDNVAARIRAADPRRLFSRGYALLRDSRGKLVRSVTDVKTDERLRAELNGGSLEARVESLFPDPKPQNEPKEP